MEEKYICLEYAVIRIHNKNVFSRIQACAPISRTAGFTGQREERGQVVDIAQDLAGAQQQKGELLDQL